MWRKTATAESTLGVSRACVEISPQKSHHKRVVLSTQYCIVTKLDSNGQEKDGMTPAHSHVIVPMGEPPNGRIQPDGG